MAAIFQIRRGTTNTSLTDGELYLHQGSGSLQFGSGSGAYNVLTLNAPSYGNIDLNGNISASGDIRIGGNLYLGNQTSDTISALGQFTTNLVPNGTIDVGTPSAKWNNVFANGLSGSLAATNGIVSGSSQIISILTSLNSFSASILTETASLETRATSLATISGSLISTASNHEQRLGQIESKSGSYDTRFTSLATISGSLISTASANTISITELNSYTASLKTAITASGANVTINGNLTVKGTTTQIDSTTLALGDNIIELNGTGIANAGLQVKDPTGGSTLSGSLLWDSTNDYWKGGTLGNESKFLKAGGDSVFTSSAQLTELNSFTGSQLTQNTSLATITGSLISSASSDRISITNINTETASLENRFTTLQSLTASYSSSINQINIETASLEARFSTLQTLTSSNLIRLTNLETTSASVNTSISNLNIHTASVNNWSASINNFTASMTASYLVLSASVAYINTIAFGGVDFNAQFSAIAVTTGSLNAFTSSANTRFSNIEAATSSYETKGRGIVSGSSQIVPLLPNGVISGSSQILGGSGVWSGSAQMPAGVVSGSSQVLGGTGIHSGSITNYLPTGVISGSSQILGGSGLFSSSAQIGNYVATITGTANQIIVAGSGLNNAGVTLSTPQSIATTSDVTFNNITASAGIRAAGDVIAYYSSDERLKENIQPIENALSKVELISGNTYDWKEGFDNIHPHKGNDVGVIAQEIEKVLPQVVVERQNGYKAVDYEKIVPLLIEAIKELSAKVKELEKK